MPRVLHRKIGVRRKVYRVTSTPWFGIFLSAVSSWIVTLLPKVVSSARGAQSLGSCKRKPNPAGAIGRDDEACSWIYDERNPRFRLPATWLASRWNVVPTNALDSAAKYASHGTWSWKYWLSVAGPSYRDARQHGGCAMAQCLAYAISFSIGWMRDCDVLQS